jgi:hypothetical protein
MLSSGIFAASLLNRFVCASHSGVSSDGTTLKIRIPCPVLARFADLAFAAFVFTVAVDQIQTIRIALVF